MSLLKLSQITKIYPGTIALDQASLELQAGQVLGLMGLNGAGKSTLIKILSGDIACDHGEIFVEETRVRIQTPKDAIEHGIVTVYQESQLVEQMTVFENVLLGHEITKGMFVDFKTMKQVVSDKIAQTGFQIPLDVKVSQLSTAQKRLVEIIKALSLNAKILVLDEPTASLTKGEAYNLMDEILKIKKLGIGIIFVSHRLDEVDYICDNATILRNGKIVSHLEKTDFSHDTIIFHLVGENKAKETSTDTDTQNKQIYTQDALHFVGNITQKIENIDLKIKQGEIIGIAGALGSGRSEFLKTLAGVMGYVEYELYGEHVKIKSIRDAIKKGVVYISEDRKVDGLFLKWKIKNNISLPYLFSKNSIFIKQKDETIDGENYIRKFGVKANSSEQTVGELSGGNQQKVLLAKWIRDDIKLILFDEPTHGVDIHAKLEIYDIIRNIANNGVGTIVVSSEMEELMQLSDYILTIKNGRFTNKFDKSEFDLNKILAEIS